MYVITDGHKYISDSGTVTVTTNPYKAYVWELEQRAQNVLVNMPRSMLRSGTWRVQALPHGDVDYAKALMDTKGLITELQSIVSKLYDNKDVFEAGRDMAERQTNDLLHEVELQSGMEPAEYYNRLGDIRRDRRNCKDGQILLGEITKHVKKEVVYGDINRLIKNMGTRKYTPRVEKDIFEEGD